MLIHEAAWISLLAARRCKWISGFAIEAEPRVSAAVDYGIYSETLMSKWEWTPKHTGLSVP